MKKTYQETISNDEVNLLPQGAFQGKIVVVDTPAAIASACDYLLSRDVIGFDTETRPAFSKGVSNKVSLLQLSSGEQAFLFRLNKIALEKPILRVMESASVLKIGAAIRDDIRALQRLRRFSPRGFIDLQSIVGDYGITELSLRKMAAITLRMKISKAQRLSNWEGNVLTPAQQSYAATDAWISREIYVELTKQQ